MPALFAVGQHRALVATSERLLPHEHLMAFLDDINVACRPERVVHIHTLMRQSMAPRPDSDPPRQNSVWNRGQMVPNNINVLQVAPRVVDPEAIVWRSSADLLTSAQGVVILGTPLGHADFVRGYLEAKSDSHGTWLACISAVQDLQAAWLILLFLRLRSTPQFATLSWRFGPSECTTHSARC